jgi:hypothetical protein
MTRVATDPSSRANSTGSTSRLRREFALGGRRRATASGRPTPVARPVGRAALKPAFACRIGEVSEALTSFMPG